MPNAFVIQEGTADRQGASFSLRSRVSRFIWQWTWWLAASWTPIPFRPWRRFLLKSFGARLGVLSDVRSSARIWHPANLVMGDRALIGPGVNCYNMAPIHIGAGALISQNAYLCTGTHDIHSPVFQLLARSISIEPHAWIAAEAFVGPGVCVGEGAVLGARGAAFTNLEPWTVYRGNPAVALRKRRLPAEEKGIPHG